MLEEGSKVVPQTVKNLAKSGLLKNTYVTPRGVRLFQPKDVERYVQERESKRQEFWRATRRMKVKKTLVVLPREFCPNWETIQPQISNQQYNQGNGNH